jgi:hypothetical protein
MKVNKKIINITMLIILITLGIVLSNNVIVFAATTKGAVSQYPELTKIVNFISFIINVIRFGAGSVTGLIVTITGWQILTNSAEKKDGLEIAKKNLKNAAWALFFIFSGTSIAHFAVGQFSKLLLG